MWVQSYDYLEHHGIKGQKWGVRRYQNPDGTLTDEGKRRYAKRVFVSGSSKTQDETSVYYRKELPDQIKDRLRRFVDEKAEIIVGDAPGIDRQVQNFLNDLGYSNVQVYGPGKKVRYSANSKWKTNPIDAPEFEVGSREWLAKKDLEMEKASTEGLAIVLDEGSKATRKNIDRLVSNNKYVDVFELSKDGKDRDRWADRLSHDSGFAKETIDMYTPSYDYLEHHGIKEQKWGVKNGPPYPLDYDDHSAAQKKANPKSSLDNYDKKEEKIDKNVKKPKKENRFIKTMKDNAKDDLNTEISNLKRYKDYLKGDGKGKSIGQKLLDLNRIEIENQKNRFEADIRQDERAKAWWDKTLKVDADSLNNSEKVGLGRRFLQYGQSLEGLDIQRKQALYDMKIRESNMKADMLESLVGNRKNTKTQSVSNKYYTDDKAKKLASDIKTGTFDRSRESISYINKSFNNNKALMSASSKLFRTKSSSPEYSRVLKEYQAECKKAVDGVLGSHATNEAREFLYSRLDYYDKED